MYSNAIDIFHKFHKTYEEMRYKINVLMFMINMRTFIGSDHELEGGLQKCKKNYLWFELYWIFFHQFLVIYKDFRKKVICLEVY